MSTAPVTQAPETITINKARAGAYVVTLPLDAIKVGARFRQDHGDLDALARSIQELGLLQPIGVDRGHNLIFGHRRFLAHQRLGLETIQARIVEVPSLIQAEHDENELRKAFTPSERVAIAEAIKAEIGNRQGKRTDKTELVENFPQVEPGQKTREAVAKAAGFGNDATYRQAKTVVEKADPALVQAVDAGEIAISTAAKLADADPLVQREAAANPQAAPAIAHNHRAQGTGENEWYTPEDHLEVARKVLGGIDLDPASSALANERVGAARYYTQEDDGLAQPWSGRVWLNPPYSQPAIAQFAEKLVSEWEAGKVSAAIALTHNYTDTAWFHRLANACKAICFTRGRIGFISPEGKKAAPTQGQAFFYFGHDAPAFCAEFRRLGFAVEVRP